MSLGGGRRDTSLWFFYSFPQAGILSDRQTTLPIECVNTQLTLRLVEFFRWVEIIIDRQTTFTRHLRVLIYAIEPNSKILVGVVLRAAMIHCMYSVDVFFSVLLSDSSWINLYTLLVVYDSLLSLVSSMRKRSWRFVS